MPLLFGIVHLWLFDCNQLPAPTEVAGVSTLPDKNDLLAEDLSNDSRDTACKQGSKKSTKATTWFQGHILTRENAVKQYGLVGVPAQSPPHIHSCMVSDHDTPTYYDLYITEYTGMQHIIKYCAMNVERSGGTGDAVELCLAKENVAIVPQSHGVKDLGKEAQFAKSLKFSTTKLLFGEQAKKYLTAFAPNALQAYAKATADVDVTARDEQIEGAEIVVCQGAIIVN